MSLATLHKAAAAATPLHNSFVPRLVVTKQTCVSSESSMRDGVSRQVYVVVKHSPFSICLALEQPIEALNNTSNRKTIGFNSGQLTARLLYDSEDEKEVDFVRMKPLEYKTRISESGTGATVECRLKVLTSQLEDMLFRIKFTLLDADNNELSPLLVARSEPIKVISKPEQPRKQKTRTKKRTLNDMLLDTLSRIEKMQQIQQERLQQITQTVSDVGGITATTRLTSVLHHHAPPLLPATAGGGGASSSSSSSSSSLSSLVALGGNVGFSSMATTPSATTTSSSYNDGHRNKKQKLLDDDRPLDFELAFRDLLDSFEALPPEQRFEQLRRFLENSGTSLDSLSELHDLFSSEGLERPIGSQVPRVGPADEEAGTTFSADGELTCECQDCPHKLELERIEEFYKEVFSLG